MKGGSDSRIYLTFDDGPDPIWTPRVLETLHLYRARATFFVVAPLATRYPYLIDQMAHAGHSVELHCTKHVRHTQLACPEVEVDARRGLEDLRALGLLPKLWRTPWGVITPCTRDVAEKLGLTLISWTVDTHDWRGDTASEMFAHAGPDLRPGAVILMHDGLGPGARRSGCEETVSLIERVIKRARSLGCEPCSMGDPYARLSNA
ncbi:MAG TPA: polysaccharide deacetylase family protein [Rubrobacteraceae bacterium]|nr:polysaccharide deacetylase family protein [Rubrobacteraceae bacterium]